MIRHLAMYLLLLGFAVGTEYSLLRLGHDLQAAEVVRGEWRLRIAEPDSHCFPTSVAGIATMSIAQSGPDVEITLAGAPKLTGTIEGAVLRATASNSGDHAAGCAPVAVLSGLNGNSMRGSLQFSRGAPIPFTADRNTADSP